MKPPWSNSELKRLGSRLRDAETVPSSLPEYTRVIAWYDDLAVRIQTEVEDALEAGHPPIAPLDLTISSRAKTAGTLRDKLRREWPIQLPAIQDLAGIRVVASMGLTRQDAVVQRLVEHFGVGDDARRDLREESHSGYRAVHLWLRREEGRAEIQVRTLLQNQWANTYEALADLAGREIRYGGDPVWIEGVPEALRSVPAGIPAPDLAAALRAISVGSIAPLETVMDMIESTWARGIYVLPDDAGEALDRGLGLVRAPALSEPPSVRYDYRTDEGLEGAHSELLSIESALYDDLSTMEDTFRSIRRDIEGSRS